MADQARTRAIPAEDLRAPVHRAALSLSDEQVDQTVRVVRRLIVSLEPDSVFVFGSRARDDSSHDSDVDLMLVVSGRTEPAYRLAQLAYTSAAPYSHCSFDIAVMDRAQFESRIRAVTSLPAVILREGHLLYDAA